MEWMKLTDACDINDKSVQEFEGLKEYVATGDIDFNNIIASETITYDNKPSRANREVDKGDIIFAKMKGTIKVFKVTEEVSDKYIFSTGFTTLNVKLNRLTQDYLYYILISDIFQNQKDKYSSGATQKAINNTNLKKIKVPVPSMPIQEQIVELLDRAQELIDKRKAQLEAMDGLIESIFYTMFGDPVRNEKGWEVKKLGEYINVLGGYAFKSKEYVDEGIPIIKIGNINRGYFETKSLCYYEERKNLDKYIVKPGDLLMSLTGTVGKNDYGNLCIIDDTFKKYYLNQRNAKLEIITGFNKLYLISLLKNDGMKKELTKNNRGVRQANISNSDINNLEIPLPPLDLQNEFAQKVELIEREKKRLEESLELMEKNYRSIMDRAFKGEMYE